MKTLLIKCQIALCDTMLATEQYETDGVTGMDSRADGGDMLFRLFKSR